MSTRSAAPLVAVTALYDVGRGRKDGRGMETYIDWLNQTLRLPLPFVIFLDPSIDVSQVHTKEEDTVIRTPLTEFPVFDFAPSIRNICATGKRINRDDLTFRLPEYGMLVMSKCEMMRRAAAMTAAPALLWIDAGLSRFLPELGGLELDQAAVGSLLAASIAVNATPNLQNALKIGRLPKRHVGTCAALINAGDIFMRRDAVDDIADRLAALVEDEWLPAGLWDNEQVAVGCLLLRGIPEAKFVNVSFGFANVTRKLFGLPQHEPSTPLKARRKLMARRLEALLTPRRLSYVAGQRAETLIFR